MLESIAENEHDFIAQKDIYFVLGEEFIIEQKMKTKEQYFETIKQEYSHQFLQFHQLEPTSKNIKLVNQFFPLEKDHIVHKIVTKQNGKTIGIISVQQQYQSTQDNSSSMNPSTQLLLESTAALPTVTIPSPPLSNETVTIQHLIENRQLFYSLLTNTNPILVNKYVFYKSVPILLTKLKQVDDSFSLTSWQQPKQKKSTDLLERFMKAFPFFDSLQRKKRYQQIQSMQQQTKQLIQQEEVILLPILKQLFFTPHDYPLQLQQKQSITASFAVVSQLLCILYLVVTMQQNYFPTIPMNHPFGHFLFHQMELFLWNYFQLTCPIPLTNTNNKLFFLQSKVKQEWMKHCISATFDFQQSQSMDFLLHQLLQ